jgi:D-alanyl-lipoteichoic acid acyltransferase DltB (MBOAT superfamily)
MTFSRVLTSYVFMPLSRALQRGLGPRRSLVMVIAYLATFLLCGYWHGPTPNFLAWGAYHGLGLIVFDAYQSRSRRRLGARGRRSSGPARAAAIAVTFLFVSLGWILFVLPLSQVFSR